MTTEHITQALDQARSKLRDHLQDVSEEISRNGDLGHLECDITAVAHDLRADLDELLFLAYER